MGIFGCRLFIYIFSMGQMIYVHLSRTFKSYRKALVFKLFGKIPLPEYLRNWQDTANLLLMTVLIVMLASEPIFHCMSSDAAELDRFTEDCDATKNIKKFPYSIFSMFAMFVYFLLLIDLAVMNNKVSAFVLVCGRMISEVGLFLLALGATILTFSSALSCLFNEVPDFSKGLHIGSLKLLEMVLNMYPAGKYAELDRNVVVLIGVCLFLVVSVIFLFNMLIAQLACAYTSIYQDMVGYARLKRIKIVVETMIGMQDKRWFRFVEGLNMEQRIEFNEGDVGLAGGIQVLEPANANPTTIDMIKRFGGSTSPSIQWPEEEQGDDDTDKFERLEKLLQKTMARITKTGGKKGNRGGSSAGEGSGSGDGGGSGGAGEDGGDGGDEDEEGHGEH